MLIGQLILFDKNISFEDPMDLWSLTKELPDLPRIRMSHDDKPHKRMAEKIEKSKEKYRNKRIILLVRDPRDVAVSHYYHTKHRGKTFDGSLGDFIRRPKGGMRTLISYYNVWAEQRNAPKDLLLVRYEDLQDRPHEILKHIAEFLGIQDVEDEILDQAVKASSFDKMRDIEANNAYHEKRLKPSEKEDTRSYKTRKGKSGTYVEEFEREDLDWLEEYIETNLDPLYDSYIYRT